MRNLNECATSSGWIERAIARCTRKVLAINEKVRYGAMHGRFREVGSNVIFDHDVHIGGPERVSIGDDVFVGRNTIIISKGGVRIGSGVGIAAGCRLITWNHVPSGDGRAVRDMPRRTGAIEIGEGAWLGYNVIVLPGVSIGRGAVVAAGAVVTRDVPDFTVVGGVPACVIRDVRSDKTGGA